MSSTPTLPLKTRLVLNLVSAVMDFTRRSNGTVNCSLLKAFGLFNVRPQSSKTLKVSDITLDISRDLWFRLFIPTQAPADHKLPVIVYFHGGGFTFFSPDLKQYDRLCRQIAEKSQAVVVSVNYRLAPEHKFPAQYDDGFDVLKFLDQKHVSTEFSAAADLSRCFVAGDSAGGNLAHHVVARFAKSAETTFTNLKIVGLIAIQPFFGGEKRTESEIRLKDVLMVSMCSTDWFWKAFLPQGEDRDHEAVNVFGPKSSDLSGLKEFPDILVSVAGLDPLQDGGKQYYEGLKKAGLNVKLVEYPNAIHAFHFFPELPEVSLPVKEISDFIRACNTIAHALAAFGKNISFDRIWSEAPPWLQYQIRLDSGSTSEADV